MPRRWLEQVGSLSEAKSADLQNAYEITSYDGSQNATAASQAQTFTVGFSKESKHFRRLAAVAK